MTDIFTQTQDVAPATPEPITTTAAVVSESAPVPAPRTAFDDNLDEFLGRDLLSEMAPAVVAAPPAEPAAPTPSVVPASPGAPTTEGVPALSQPAPANGGTPPATTTQPAPAGETAKTEVDPGLLFKMFSAEPKAEPAAPAQPVTSAPPAASQDADEIPMPFTAQLNLPDALVQTLFESEDPVQRKQALSALMAALGNAVVGYVETRVKEFHTPKLVQQFETAQSVKAQAAAVGQHFYGTYPELAQYKQVVERAGKIVLDGNPTAAYSEEIAAQIAGLARAALAQMGKSIGTAPAPVTPAAPQQQAAPSPAPTPYVAGGVTPGGPLDQPADSNSPGAIFEQMQSVWN